MAKEVDPYIEANGNPHGIHSDAASFPGWKNFAALVVHLKFVRGATCQIGQVAVVSDSSFLTIASRFAAHFVHADVRHFPQSDRKPRLPGSAAKVCIAPELTRSTDQNFHDSSGT